MKFDYVLANPPFCRTLHLRILESVLEDIPEKTQAVFLHPARWLINPAARMNKDDLKTKVESVEVFDCVKANKTFGIEIPQSDLMIAKYSNRENNFDLKEASLDVLGIYDSCLEKSKPIVPEKEKPGFYWVPLNNRDGHNKDRGNNKRVKLNRNYGIFHNGKNENGFTLIEEKNRNIHSTNGQAQNWLGVNFKTYKEALNFCEYCKSNFLNYFLQFTFNPKCLPFPGNWERRYSEKEICDWFELTKEQAEYIENLFHDFNHLTKM